MHERSMHYVHQFGTFPHHFSSHHSGVNVGHLCVEPRAISGSVLFYLLHSVFSPNFYETSSGLGRNSLISGPFKAGKCRNVPLNRAEMPTVKQEVKCVTTDSLMRKMSVKSG